MVTTLGGGGQKRQEKLRQINATAEWHADFMQIRREGFSHEGKRHDRTSKSQVRVRSSS
jgi:hypothetical protein